MKTIPLQHGMVVLVDDEDYELVKDHAWRAHKTGKVYYAATSITATRKDALLMHRLLLNAQPGQVIDHLNRDGLDNRRSNIRITTSARNNHNRLDGLKNKSGFRGVSKDSQYEYWRAYIRDCGKTKHLGCFGSPQDAARAYDLAALRIYGEHAVTNFPRNSYE